MLHVAAAAVVGDRAVHALLLCDPVRDRLVTGQAALGRQRSARVVAPLTVADAFELRVRGRERARGHLQLRFGRGQACCRQKEPQHETGAWHQSPEVPGRRGRWSVTSTQHRGQDAKDGSAPWASGGQRTTAGRAAAGLVPEAAAGTGGRGAVG